jgi:hypothetical protein
MGLPMQALEKLNIKFGKVTLQDFEVSSPLIDSGTAAVIVADIGHSTFLANPNEQNFSLLFKQKKRIKILHKNGFDAATITIPLYVNGSKAEELEDLDAYTYNVENGKVVKTKVERGSVFTERHNKNWIHKKFTFPALKEGSIIEYSYEVKSDFFFNLQSWVFQGDYPVLWSQYDAEVPDFFKYVTLTQGYHPFHVNKKSQSNVIYSFNERVERETNRAGVALNSSLSNFNIKGILEQNTWVMKDVPALKEEAFTTTVRNAVSKIEFQLNQVAFPNTIPTNYLNTWEKAAEELYKDERFGMLIDRPNNWLDDDVAAIVKTAPGKREKAEAILDFVRDNFTFNGQFGIYTSSTLRDVFKNKSGSVADINMLLIAMLKTQKIEAVPVILSTRENGFTHMFYPLMNRYNYVIAKVLIDNNPFYLDATTKKLPFGRLPGRIYNGQAREIYPMMAEPVNFLADSLREVTMTSVFISNADKSGQIGSFTQNMGPYRSLGFRSMFAGTTREEFQKTLQKDLSEDITISNIQTDSLKILANPVALKFDLSFKPFEEDIIYFSPMMGEALKNNPFKAAQRFYPVEMPYTKDDIYVLHMEIPSGYKVDELPKSVRLMFNENEGMFEYLISADATSIQMRARLQFNKATFTNEDYQPLRELYTYIVKKEAEQIVFKKIK